MTTEKKKKLRTISDSPSERSSVNDSSHASKENASGATEVLAQAQDTSVYVSHAKTQNSTANEETPDSEASIAIEQFTDSQWADIKACAQAVFDSKEFGGDQFKSAIRGFLNYLLRHDLEVVMGDEEIPSDPN